MTVAVTIYQSPPASTRRTSRTSTSARRGSPERSYRRRVRIESVFGEVVGLLVILAVYLMVTKPGL